MGGSLQVNGSSALSLVYIRVDNYQHS